MRSLMAGLALLLAACAHDAGVAASPSGPCRDDENFENGRCVARIPGDRLPPGGLPPWTRP